jgi:uncharacterized protein (TIGR00730 family)
MKIFIGCSSYDDLNDIYYKEAKNISNVLVNKDFSLVFGGCAHGIMGTVYDVFKTNNKEIFAIQTEHYKEELNNIDCNKEVKSSTLEQLERFMELSDIIMFLPGGYGTYNEIFYMISEYVNETHHNKIIVMNINHYFDELKLILNKIKEEKFASLFDFVRIVENSNDLDSLLEEIC